MTTAYAIWAPGVGYMTDQCYNHAPHSDVERRHDHDIAKARVFRSLEDAYGALQGGLTTMVGIELRKLEPVLTPKYVDVGLVA